MKLSFSTIGCPDWTLDDIIATAKDLNYDGIEIRGIGGELYAPAIKQLNEGGEKLTAKLSEVGIAISCLASGATFAVYEKKDEALREAKEYIDLAKKLKVPFVRIMSTDKPYYDGGDISLCKKLFKETVRYAEGSGVTPLMETNGLFVDSALLNSFLEETGGGALWDVHHPFRFNGESIATTANNLKGKIKYVHLKDSVVVNGNTAYRIMGYGDVPIKEALDALKGMNYDGYLTMEWVKRWNRELEEPGVVFAHFPYFVRRTLK